MTTHRCWVYGDNVNTDVIFPGKYTYTLKTPEDIAAHALEDLDPNFVKGVQAGDVIVAGSNWGMGSSREQGVTTIKFNGVNLIIAASFSGLYFRNCINQ
nr:3-isopropylmalate dehydratase [Anaerolineae bacterium]